MLIYCLCKHFQNCVHLILHVQGQRLKKLEARKIREAKEEEEKVQIDIEEAKFQAARRKEAIEQAKTLQYYQTDRVKGFHVSFDFSIQSVSNLL